MRKSYSVLQGRPGQHPPHREHGGVPAHRVVQEPALWVKQAAHPHGRRLKQVLAVPPSNFLTRGDTNVDTSNIQQILQSFRDNLPSESKTARAIDWSANLEEISACAEEEGLHEFASMLFEAEQEQGRGGS